MNQIKLYFTLCTPAPSGGYTIYYRMAGSSDEYANAGNFFVSPAIFYDTLNPAGTCYEGFIVSDCNSVIGNQVSWNSCESGESGEERILTFSVLGGATRNISVSFNLPIDVDLSIDSVFVDGNSNADCTGEIVSHLHSTSESIAAGNNSYIGADVTTGVWASAMSFTFYGIVLSWPGNSSVIIHNGDVLVMGSYMVTIVIDGC